jgi:hypothetical protein
MLDHRDIRTTTATCDELLKKLRANLAEHVELVEEAREGYEQKCEDALNAAVGTLAGRIIAIREHREKGSKGRLRMMEHIRFDIAPPEDHRREFETVIAILELQKNAHDSQPGGVAKNGPATIQLKAVDVQRYFLNDWDWSSKFLRGNAQYSAKSQILAHARGLM